MAQVKEFRRKVENNDGGIFDQKVDNAN